MSDSQVCLVTEPQVARSPVKLVSDDQLRSPIAQSAEESTTTSSPKQSAMYYHGSKIVTMEQLQKQLSKEIRMLKKLNVEIDELEDQFIAAGVQLQRARQDRAKESSSTESLKNKVKSLRMKTQQRISDASSVSRR